MQLYIILNIILCLHILNEENIAHKKESLIKQGR